MRKRGKYYRKIRLDIWGYYAMYYKDRIMEGRRVDHSIKYWMRLRRTRRAFKKYMRGKYIFRLWNRPRRLRKKKFKPNFIRPRHLRSFYMVLKKKTYLKYVKIAMKGKLVRGFASTYLGYLEGRLFIIIYRLNIVNNIFMIKSLINLGVFFKNLKKKTHINTRFQLGDFLHIHKSWKNLLKFDISLRLEYNIIAKNIDNFYCNFIQFYFIFFKVYNIKKINYPIRIDLYRAIDFIGPLR
jgi:ribosomal protein S4